MLLHVHRGGTNLAIHLCQNHKLFPCACRLNTLWHRHTRTPLVHATEHTNQGALHAGLQQTEGQTSKHSDADMQVFCYTNNSREEKCRKTNMLVICCCAASLWSPLPFWRALFACHGLWSDSVRHETTGM